MTNSLTVVDKVFFEYIDIFAAKTTKATHVFFAAKNINVFAIFQDSNFNVMIANSTSLSFEQLGPGPGCSKPR